MPWQPRVREGQRQRPAGRLYVELHEAAQTTPTLSQGRSKEKSTNHPSRNRQKTISQAGSKGSPKPKQEIRQENFTLGILAHTCCCTCSLQPGGEPILSFKKCIAKQEKRKIHHPSRSIGGKRRSSGRYYRRSPSLKQEHRWEKDRRTRQR